MNDDTTIDFAKDAEESREAKRSVGVEKLTEMAREMASHEVAIKEAETLIKDLSAKKRALEEDKIPTIMEEMEISDITLDTGEKIKVRKIIKSQMPTKAKLEKADPTARQQMLDRREATFAWLENNNAGSLINRTFKIEFDSEDEEFLKEVALALEKVGAPYIDDKGVHHKRLDKFLEEYVEAGNPIPNSIDVWIGQKASIKIPKN